MTTRARTLRLPLGELSVGQGAGDLERPDQEGKDAERVHACRLRIVKRQAGGDLEPWARRNAG